MKMYHATYASYLSSILERGLGALTPHKNWSQSVRGVVYLSSNPDCAIDMQNPLRWFLMLFTIAESFYCPLTAAGSI